MAIDDSGEWSVGSLPEDIRDYLDSYTEDSYKVHEYRQCKCICGSLRFALWIDEEECSAKRICADCGEEGFIFDGEEYWTGENAELCGCPRCESDDEVLNVGIGYALYKEPNPDDALVGVRWIYVGARCAACGLLGCFGDWKIGADVPRQMLDRI